MSGNITEVLTTEDGSSFTALLGLPPNQAVELLHESESRQNQVISAMEINADMQIRKLNQSYNTNCSSMFNSSSDLVERASRFSIFTKNDEEMFATNFAVSSDSSELKKEPIDTDSNPDSSPIFCDSSILNEIKKRSSTKRKEREKIKVKICGGKSKDKEICEKEADCKKLPYVHVRARPGQATGSHSLAERARREKINVRMKLLQELVPGCAEITGTALVLDEIINHVQSLQRQVEFLSTKLATNPRMDFSLESLLSLQSGGSLTVSSFPSTITSDPSLWPDLIHTMNNNSSSTTTGTRGGEHQYQYDHYQQHQNQLLQQHHLWHPDMFQQQPVWGRDSNRSFATSPDNSVYSSYTPTNSVVFRPGAPDQLKMDI